MSDLNEVNRGSRVFVALVACTVAAMFVSEPVLAQAGGLDKVNTFMESVLDVLRAVSITTVTIGFIWAGYKFMYQRAELLEVGKILAGALLVGGASELAIFFLSA